MKKEYNHERCDKMLADKDSLIKDLKSEYEAKLYAKEQLVERVRDEAYN